MQEKLVAAIALVAGVAFTTGALAQSSGSSQPSSTTESSSQSGQALQPQSSPPSPSSQPSASPTSPSAPAPSSQAGQPGMSGQPQGVLVDASALIGATVRSPQGKDIGKVDRLMVDPKDGRIRTVVIQQGGTLGVGGKSVSMPWESVKVGQDGGNIVVTAEQQMLDQAPAASPRTDSKSERKKSEEDKSDSKK